MEWLISLVVVIGTIIIVGSVSIEWNNSHYYFSDCNLLEKISRVVTYILIGCIGIGALFVVTWFVKEIIFG